MECFKAPSCFYIHENADQLKGFRKYFIVKLFTICITKKEDIYDAVLIAKALFSPGKKQDHPIFHVNNGPPLIQQ